MTYGEKLRDPRWQKKRLEILQRDDNDIYILKIYLEDKSVTPQLRLNEETLKEYLNFYKQ